MKFTDNIRQLIVRHHLLHDGERVLVALSGGADSVALLLVLRDLGYPLEAAHCHFHLRDEEANRDASFVEQLCKRLDVPLHRADFNTKAVAKVQKVSLEMAARDLRYTWFRKLLRERNIRFVAVAHHQEDNTETFFLNLLRGAGLQGLTGISVRTTDVIRPLLGVTRQEIETYLKEKGEAFVVDSTNADTYYRRNKLRQEILPLLRQINPSLDRTLAETMQRMAEADNIVGEQFEKFRKESVREETFGISVEVDTLLNSSASQTYLFLLMKEYGFSSSHISDIFPKLQGESGIFFTSTTGWATLHQGRLILSPIIEEVPPTPLCESNTTLSAGRTLLIEKCEKVEISRVPEVATLDADKIQGELFVRSLQPGDRFHPYGMKGSKLVSDYLTNCHRSRIHKRAALIVCDAAGPLWLVGERIDCRAAISETTTRCLKLSLHL